MQQSEPGTNLRSRYAALAESNPRIRAFDAAAMLEVSEGELVAAGCIGRATRLKPDWKGLFERFGGLGRVMALTRNQHAVHEKVGRYEEVDVRAHGGLVLGPDIDLRLFLNRWRSGFAVETGTHTSLQFFDGQGRAVHKIYAREETDRAAWAGLVADFTSDEPEAPVVAAGSAPAAAPERRKPKAGAEALREAWAGLKDTHDFVVMLSKLGLERLEAFRLVGSDMAEPVATGALRRTLEAAAASGQSIMVFVPNKATIQIHTGPVANLKAVGEWFNVMDPGFNLHLKETAIDQAWVVRKPTTDGIVTSLELFDSDGVVIAYLFGARKPGQAEAQGWRDIIDGVAAGMRITA
ncbi:hemin-degrading factor [Desertibaculum subflavum]|uniref:hemin-degrading factor n=1 Tax=Desertibaculum subflavum TaxID=2268458 RepID=UPI000E66D274